jgi:superfamily II DNA/RNA helicase
MPRDNEFIVPEADSSQKCAIANVLAGQNAAIHGPPGTGKSRTIANIVATLARVTVFCLLRKSGRPWKSCY